MKPKAKLFIISAPSGAGKTTLVKAVLKRLPGLLYSVSYTTRPPRGVEKQGADYFFINKKEFIKNIEKKRWAEWAEVYGNFYGTSSDFLDKNLGSGKSILLDLDIKGTLQILKRYPDSITIFIMPPSLDVLKRRLESRGTDGRKEIKKRLLEAKKEMAKKDLYHHIIINDDLKISINDLVSFMEQKIAIF